MSFYSSSAAKNADAIAVKAAATIPTLATIVVSLLNGANTIYVTATAEVPKIPPRPKANFCHPMIYLNSNRVRLS